MAITGRVLNNYNEKLKNFILGAEGDDEFDFYVDSKGVLTIGAGYAISEHSGKWQSTFTKAGITYTDAQKEKIGKLIRDVNKKSTLSQKRQVVTEYYSKSDSFSLSSSNQVNSLFRASLSEFENTIKNKLGTEIYNDLNNTSEMIALMSLAYNKS